MMISRPYYTDWLKRWKDKDVIKVITGMRRAGKSTIMQLYQEDLLQLGVPSSHMVSLNFENLENEYPLTSQELYDFVVARLAPQETTYVFLDEVQRVKEFETVVNALFVRDDVDLYLTGSNAYLLSGELATFLTGRYVEIQAHPFSFKEYYSALAESSNAVRPVDKNEAFNRYLTYGGLPYASTLDSERDTLQYLEGVFNTIVMKDIALRNPQMDMRAFKATASFLADNVGNISSVRRITDAIAQHDRKTSQGSVGKYIDSLLESYLLHKVDRFDLRGKQYLQTLEKYYLGDLGFRFWLLGKSAGDVGRRIENVIYLELCRRFTTIAIGKQKDQEIDFVASSMGEREYFQVAQTVLDEHTLQRELNPLLALKDNHPKTLLTLDTLGTGDIQGVKHKNLIEWLLE